MQRGTKRFYRDVAIARGDRDFHLLLGDRLVRTPAGARLALSTAALAGAVANEWLAQGATVYPETMPLTRLAATAIDRMTVHRAAVIDALVAYADSDLICYRAEEPPDLVALQTALWQPLVEWAATVCGTRLRVCEGVLPIVQPRSTVNELRGLIHASSACQLAVLATVVPATGSLIIGVALLRGRLDADAAVEAALLDERWQARHWGVDEEAEARRTEIADDIRTAALFLSLSGDSAPSPLPVDAATP